MPIIIISDKDYKNYEDFKKEMELFKNNSKDRKEEKPNNMQYTEEHWKTRSELVKAILDKDMDKVTELIKKSIALEKQANNK